MEEMNETETLATKQARKDEIRFNKILAKIPEEHHVYVQESVFNQFKSEAKLFEKWKKKL